MKDSRDRLRDDEGAVAIIVVILFVVFLGLAALAIDVGYYYNVRRQLQAAADAGALAGAMELKMSGDAAVADSQARQLVAANGQAPGDGVRVESVIVGSDYCQVTVAKNAPLFFGAAAGQSGGPLIRAMSRAKLSLLTGMKGIVPWFLPVIVPTSVRAQLSGGGNGVELTPAGGNTFSSGWDPGLGVSMTTAAGKAGKGPTRTVYGRLVDYVARNAYGVEQRLDGASSIVVLPDDSPIDAIRIDPHMVGVGGGFDLVVEVNARAAEAPKATMAGGSIGGPSPSGAGASTYTFHGVATSEGGDRITISVAERPAGSALASAGVFVVQDAAVVAVTSATSLFRDLEIGPTCFKGSSGGSLYTLKMTTLDGFLAGEAYSLKVGSGDVLSGNFQALALGGTGASDYRTNIAQGYPGTVYIGQLLSSEPGNMVGPTAGGLRDRIGMDAHSTYASWVAAGSPPCPRIVYVPICEWTAQPLGRSEPVIVRGFAAFFVEGDPSGTSTGIFIQYVAPGIPGPDPPPFLKALMTARLVSEGVTF
ncbi:MAG TPA: pilus assembly protein TadG-related protein [Coriobacteriia bacterium]|jgi:hypothetical protein